MGTNSPLLSMPKCVTAIDPHPPTGFEWQLWQFDLFMAGPSPVAGPNGVAYASRPAQNSAVSGLVRPTSGSPAFGCRVTPPPASATDCAHNSTALIENVESVMVVVAMN